jgi:hypothetical protein
MKITTPSHQLAAHVVLHGMHGYTTPSSMHKRAQRDMCVLQLKESVWGHQELVSTLYGYHNQFCIPLVTFVSSFHFRHVRSLVQASWRVLMPSVQDTLESFGKRKNLDIAPIDRWWEHHLLK